MSNATGGRPTKNERREQAREQARELRAQAQKRDRRNRVLLQSGIIVGVLAVIAIVALVIVNSVKPAGPGPANLASGGILFESDGNGGIKAVTGPGLEDGGTPTASASDAQIRIQTFVDLTCPVCDQFELGLVHDGLATQDQLTASGLTGSPEDYVGNLDYIENLVEQGIASLEIFPVAILDRSWQGSAFSTRSGNAFAAIAAGDPDHLLDFVKGMYENQPAEGSGPGLTDDQMISIAQSAGVDLTAQVTTADGEQSIEDAIKGQSYKKWVTAMTSYASNFSYDFMAAAKSAAAAQNSGFGTPTILVNEQLFTPSDTWANNASFKAFVLQVAGESTSSTPAPTDGATPTGDATSAG